MMRLVCLVGTLLLVSGCDTAPAAKKKTTTRKPVAEASQPATPKPRPAPSQPEVAADAFASVDEAVGVLTLAADAGANQDRKKAAAWLAMQGTEAVPALTAAATSADAGDRTAIAITRILGRIGTGPAGDALVKIAGSDAQLVRINAVDQLGVCQPATPKVVAALAAMLDHDDERTRLHAIKALGKIGEPAQAVVPKLVEILNSKQNDALRKDAKLALRKIDPRKGLMFD